MHPVVILGLGVSGLGCGIELARQGIPFTAFDKEDRAGGLSKTDAAGGFLFDRGPHILLGLPTEIEALVRGLDGMHLVTCAGRSGIVLGTRLDGVIPAPFQRHLNHLPLSTRARLLPGMLRDACGWKPPANYAEYAAARCGRGVFDLFLGGYDSKRLRYPLEEAPADWTNRIEKTSLASLFGARGGRNGNAAGEREGRFLYPQDGGIEALPKAMARLLPEGSLRFGAEAVEIRREEKLVLLTGGEAVRYGHLVTSLPLPETLAAIPNLPPEIQRAAADLLFTSIYILNAGIEGDAPPWTLLRLPAAEIGFYRLSFPSRYSDGCAPPGHSAIVGEISHHPERHPLSRDEAGRQFRAGLEQLGILRPRQPMVFERIHDIRYGHVLYNQRTRASLQAILEYLRSHSIFPCGKYGLWQDLLIPQSILSGMQAAREIIARQ